MKSQKGVYARFVLDDTGINALLLFLSNENTRLRLCLRAASGMVYLIVMIGEIWTCGNCAFAESIPCTALPR